MLQRVETSPCVQLSFQELRNTIAYEESGKYAEEVEGLEEGVARLRMQGRQKMTGT